MPHLLVWEKPFLIFAVLLTLDGQELRSRAAIGDEFQSTQRAAQRREKGRRLFTAPLELSYATNSDGNLVTCRIFRHLDVRRRSQIGELRGEAQRRRAQSSKQMVLGRLVCTGRSRICRIQFLKLLRIKCQ